VKRHIDDIADKYICPGETLDFALMYIPAENVYYEIVLKEEDQEEVLNYAWKRRVFAASPNSFYAYLQAIAVGLKGLQVEQSARAMLDSLTRLKGDFDRFSDDYRLVGTHLGRAQAKYGEGLPRLESIQRALPGQLTTAALDSGPDADETTEAAPQQPLQWEYSPPTSKRGRPRGDGESPVSDGME
jgi:DNA anti-recombination protein RmuC